MRTELNQWVNTRDTLSILRTIIPCFLSNMQDRPDPTSQKFESILPFLLAVTDMRPKRAEGGGFGGGVQISRVLLSPGQVPNVVASVCVWVRVTV